MTASIIFLIFGIAFGLPLGLIMAHGRKAATQALLDAERKARADERETASANIDAVKQECHDTISALKQEHARTMADTKAEAEQLYTARVAEIKAEAAHHLKEAKEEAAAQLKAAKEEAANQREQELKALRERYDELLEKFKAEVTASTQQLLKDRSAELQEANAKRMEDIFKPINDNISRMEKSMTDNRVASAQSNSRFEQIISQMIESNAKIGSQADRLSTALQRKNKVTGNWGELILTELLESQGLEEGVHFHVQQTIRDDAGHTVVNEQTGARMIPDVVMHLGDNRDVVIDSKMSLTAFVDYQNAEDEATRLDALHRHIESVRAHIKELAGKNYSEYIGKKGHSIDFVIMFMPIDAALQLALNESPKLWREAFDKKVFIAGAQNLIAALHIIRLTWVAIEQERNTEKIMDEARKLVERVGAFYKEFADIHKKLSATAAAFDTVTKRVETGSQSILATGNRLISLGVRTKKGDPLPQAKPELPEETE